MANENAKSRDPGLLILASLAAGPRHGYAMIEDIARFTGTRLGPGTLYGALARLEERGLIEPVESDDRRRPYRLTAAGAELLTGEVDALERVVQHGAQPAGAMDEPRIARLPAAPVPGRLARPLRRRVRCPARPDRACQ